ncbi:type I restriction endonuclease subunit S [Mycobacterium sp. ENV421]|nr:type I restriction endonuclease subunit S [Mycobacterium sp. ENV421]
MSEFSGNSSHSPIYGLPSHWGVTKFGYHFRESDERNGSNPVGKLLSISEYRGVEINTRTDGQKASLDISKYRVVRPKQLAANMMWLNHGGIGVSSLTGHISPDYKVFHISDSFEPRYVHHLFRSPRYVGYFAAIATGVRPNAQRVTKTVLDATPVPLPSLVEQTRIADYLDRETREIDAMLSRMNELVASLRERKAGVIQRETVDRDGVFTRLKFRADISLGKTVQGSQQQDDESFVNYVRAASIQHHGLELDDQRMWMTADELAKYDLRTDDVLIVEGGAGYGRSVVLEADMPGWGFQNHVIRVRPQGDADGRFLDYCVKGHYSAGLIDVMVDGATIPALSSEKARELPIPDLDLDEQIKIADQLDEATAQVDAMLARVADLKALLLERRAALITDVVTGRNQVA